MNIPESEVSSAPPGQREDARPKLEQLRLSGRLPSPKGVALAIMEACRNEDTSLEDIARIVRTDPALAGRLLRLANSAAAGGLRPVAAIPDAVKRLGLGAVRQVAMGFSLVDQYHEGPCAGFDYTRFWSHSLLMGVAMQSLGALVRVASPDELFACGLLARIGCLALATIHPVEYAELLEGCADDTELAARERERLQADHNEVTVSILDDCGIPRSLAEPIFFHEAPENSRFTEGSRPYQLAHLFYHAKRVADMGLAPEATRGGIISELMLLGGKLGLDASEQGSLVDRIIAEWQEWAQILKVPAHALPPFAAMASAPAPRTDDHQPDLPALRVLLAGSGASARNGLQAMLADLPRCTVHAAGNGREALALALEVMPQIVVCERRMPDVDGIGFCQALRATDWGQSMYVIMLTDADEEEELVQAFEAGVDDYIARPVNGRALRARLRAALHYVRLLEAWERDRAQLKQFAAELAISNRKLEHYALTDLLTGLPNRRAGMEVLGQSWAASHRSGQGLSVMMLDIDHFKSVNDTHGHAVGDKVLIEVSRLIRDSLRKGDHVCRMGGEEFLVINQGGDLEATLQFAERLRQKIRSARIRIGDAELGTSVSIGVACREPGMADADGLIVAADRALYAAKRGGRDRSCCHAGGRLLCR
jgi:diguanylate cyclase (GGDEF)-like protein